MKTISKGLILALVIQFALILPFVNIIGVKKAKAEGPVPPSDPVISFVSNSTAQQVITLKVQDSSDWTLTFQTESIDVENFYDNLINDDQLPELRPGRPVNNSDIIRKYKVTSPNISCASDYMAGSDLTGVHSVHYESDIYLITVKYTGGGEPDSFLQSGMYRESQENQKLVKLVNSDMNNDDDFCGNISSQQRQIINLTRSSGYINSVIRLEIPEGERVTRCNNLQMRWNNIIDNMRKLMIPAPSSTPGSGETGNRYWVHRDAVSVNWLDFGRWVVSAFGAASYGSVFDDTYEYTLDLGLTDEGQTLYDEIADWAEQIKTDIDALRQAYPGNSWPEGCIRIEEFKWSETAPANDYASLDAFYTDFDKIYQKFKDHIASRDEPISTGGDDICGNTGTNLVSGKIFQWLFCELANIIHGIAASIMKRATGWLTDSIGVDINIRFKEPKEDDYPTDGVGANTPAPGAGTPTPETSTPTPRTAAPMNISGEVIFDEEGHRHAEFAGHLTNFFVKNADSASEIIDVNANCDWDTSWEDNHGKVPCTFTTTQNIPTNWTSVTIYSSGYTEASGFRFRINYPPANNRSSAQASLIY